MRLSEVVKTFRNEHGLSMDAFANDAKLSKAYISMIENERNPSTGKPITPSIEAFYKLAAAMRMDINDLIAIIDDTPIDISGEKESVSPNLTCEDRELLALFHILNQTGKAKALEYLSDLADNSKYVKSGKLLEA